jgi:uncharacterized protein YcfJ
MKKIIIASLLFCSASAFADNYATVIKSVPVYENYAYSQNVCIERQVTQEEPNTLGVLLGAGVGILIGSHLPGDAVLNGVLGGVAGGAMQSRTRMVDRTIRNCTPEIRNETRLRGYETSYRFGNEEFTDYTGQQFPIGSRIKINISLR